MKINFIKDTNKTNVRNNQHCNLATGINVYFITLVIITFALL